MKILIVTGIYPPFVGGPATYSKLLFDELPKRGVEVKVVSFDSVRYLPKIIRHIVFFLKICKESKGFNFIYAQDTVSVGLPALVASFILRKRFFIRVPGDYAWEQSRQRFGVTDTIDDFQNKKYGIRVEILRSIQSFVVGHSDVAITPSIYFKNLVRGWCSEEQKIVAIYNGIDLEENKISKEGARDKLGISKDEKIIVSAGRLVPWKGFKGLILSLKKLLVDDVNWKLIILGHGPQRDSLENFVVKHGLKERVIFTGDVSRKTMFDYLRASDVFALNTSFESFSFQVVEVMHSGLPIVTTSIGSLPELITDGKEGFLVKPDDIGQFVEKIKYIYNNDSKKQEIVENARIKSKMFSIENSLDKLLIEFGKYESN